MIDRLFLVFPTVAAALFSVGSPVTPEENFWKWFQQNETALFGFEQDQERIFDTLLARMHKVDPRLTFEFGPVDDGETRIRH